MTPSEQAAAHDANFAGVFATLARSVEHGFAGRVREVPVASLGVPVGFFNAAWPSAGTLPEAMVAAVYPRPRTRRVRVPGAL